MAELESLYRARFSEFARFAAAACGDADLGRDAVQAAFTVAVRERKSFRREGDLAGWIWRIVVNEARRVRRSGRRGEPPRSDAPSSNGRADDPLGLRALIAALPERQREAVFLRYYADLDYRTIADLLGVEVGTISATLSAAHQTLRKRLEEARR